MKTGSATSTTRAADLPPAETSPAASPAARVEIILNASAGTGGCEDARSLLQKIFAEAGREAHVSLARDGDELLSLAASATRDPECRVVVAGGGDGTVSAVASALIGTDKTLAVLPLGTLNHFAKDLGIPLGIEAAARSLLAGREASVDACEVNGRIFINNSGLGIYPSIVRERERRQDRHGLSKWVALAWATLSVLRRYPFLNVRLSADGRTLSRRTPFVFVGNNEYVLDAFQIGSRERLDDGRLCLHLARRDTGRLGLLRLTLGALTGRLREDRDFESISTDEVLIETRRSRLRVATDGEVSVMQGPLRYRVLPGALRVIVPEESATEDGELKSEG